MMRYRIAAVVSAFAIALWATQDTKSFLMALCIAAAILAIGIGVAVWMGGVSAECPTITYTQDDLDRIESHAEFMDALEKAVRR